MRPRLTVVLLGVGIAALGAGTALVSNLPTARTAATTASGHPSSTAPNASVRKAGPRRVVAPVTRARTGGSSASTSPNRRVVPPSTAFVVSTITYDVKQGDTVSTIARWFEQRGYSRRFAANLQVIELNKNLLVPGALVSIANGVMTIESPA